MEPRLNIDWHIDAPILSKRDADEPTLADFEANNELSSFAECVSTKLSS